jgi:Zn-finger nucleic acid-binding protein
MNCASCGAPLRLTETEDFCRCDYCGAIYTPEQNADGIRLLGETAPAICPVCGLPLEKAAISGHRILYCKHCEGMLIPMDDFVSVTEELRSKRSGHGSIQPPANRKDLERHIDCPQCHQPMDTHFYEGPGNIVIDDCSRCLVNWLDKSELMRVVRAPD